MSKTSILRVQKRGRAAHGKHGRMLRLSGAGGILSDGHMGSASASLSMPEGEDTRATLISGAVSALVHLLIIGGIAVIGMLAEEAIEVIIPVQIINEVVELPGSNEPAPIPKMLAGGAAASAAALAPAPSVMAAVPAAAAQAPSLEAAAPTQIDVAQVQSQPLAAAEAIKPTASAADIGDVKPFEVDMQQLDAPTIDHVAPTVMAVRTEINTRAPSNLADFSQANALSYAAAANANAIPTANATDVAGTGVDTGVSSQYLSGTGGFGGGGNPNGVVGTVPCMQSAFVVRYTKEIERRTRARWVVPMGTADDDYVTLRFRLDHAGSVTEIKSVKTTNDEFGKSAVEALRMASPFPPLDDNVRCLSEKKRLTLTFRNS